MTVTAGFSGVVPVENTCDGDDRFAVYVAENIPPSARFIAYLVDDPDAPGGDFTHYLAWNQVPGGEKTGVTGKNDFGKVGWSGPCPPSGQTHHYHFRVFAQDAALSLAAGADRAAFDEALKGHVLADGELVATYTRRPK